MTARDILYNVQSEYSICVTVAGNTYVDLYPVGGGDVKRRLMGGLIFTEAIPPAWGNRVRDVLGSIRAANTPLAPLTEEYKMQWRGLEYQIDICGIESQRLGNQVVTTFDNRFPFYSGIMNGCPRSENGFLFSFGSNEAIWQTQVLSTLLLNGDFVDSKSVSFSEVSPTLVRSLGDIDVDVSRASLSAASSPITLDFSQALTDLSLSVESAVEKVTHNDFSFSQVSQTKITSSSTMEISIEIENNTDSAQTFTITSSVPMDSMVCDFRYFYSGGTNATNFSIQPDSIEPPFGPRTSEVSWSNMGGVTSLTFTASSIAAPFVLDVDEGGRGQIKFGAKLWVKEVIERKAKPAIGAFSISPTTTPSDGDFGSYSWSGAAIQSIQLTNTFDLSDGDLSIAVDRNRVSFENDLMSLTLVLNRAYVDPAGNESKLAFAPLWMGENTNVTPLELYSGGYYISSEGIAEVRHDGVVVPQVSSLGDVIQNDQNGVLSWAPVKTPQVIDGKSAVIQVSAVTGLVTVDAGSPSTVGGLINELAALAGIPVGSIDPTLAAYPAAWIFTGQQITFEQALNTILAPLDSFPRIQDGELVVEKRQLYSESYDRVIDSNAHVVGDPISSDLSAPNYHELIVKYNKNWTVQDTVNGYKSEFQEVSRNEDSVKYSDYPTNTIASGSLSKTVVTCLKSVDAANDQLVILDREKREHLPVKFYLNNRHGDITNNTSVKIDSILFDGGMFLPESKMLDSDRKRTFVKGVWYGR